MRFSKDLRGFVWSAHARGSTNLCLLGCHVGQIHVCCSQACAAFPYKPSCVQSRSFLNARNPRPVSKKDLSETAVLPQKSDVCGQEGKP